MNQIKTNEHWHPNTSINFDANGIWIRVSLNIPPSVAKHLSPNNVNKGKHHIVYALKIHITSDMINAESMRAAQKLLLNNCMKNIRNAKKKEKQVCNNLAH